MVDTRTLTESAEKERQEMEQLTKLMTMKSAQIIVQSRMGEKLHTYCNNQNSSVSIYVIQSIYENKINMKYLVQL